MKNEFRCGDEVRIKSGEYEGRIGKIYEIKSDCKFPILIIGWGIFGNWDYRCNSSEIEKVE